MSSTSTVNDADSARRMDGLTADQASALIAETLHPRLEEVLRRLNRLESATSQPTAKSLTITEAIAEALARDPKETDE